LRFLPAFALAIASLLAIGMSEFQPGPPGTPVAVFFRPFADHDTALLRVAAAGGEILRHGASGTIVIARSDDPAFTSRLYGAGALMVSAAIGNWICGPAPDSAAL
jgi:hypothetical protein